MQNDDEVKKGINQIFPFLALHFEVCKLHLIDMESACFETTFNETSLKEN